ncbi:unnamed protein product [Chondrus crispus]|uniref:Uncharacterized protein n=1 Tax=Chondrus crispus TaxID=2769 RepID=R7QFP2_CHOCR|nr:unnamed protein product [Chondrus crispus]CDF36271.1 unnamed protein product [Chondrus crispus]|eukprot:XP_005716090.1 unnamed protein product [Chondrus crispus]
MESRAAMAKWRRNADASARQSNHCTSMSGAKPLGYLR